MRDKIFLGLLVIFFIGIFWMLYLFLKWIKGNGLTQKEKSRRLIILLIIMGIYFIITSFVALLMTRFSYSGIGWKHYFWLFLGLYLVYSCTGRNGKSNFNGISEDDKKELSKLKLPLKYALFATVAIGMLALYEIENSKNPIWIVLFFAQVVPFYLVFRIQKSELVQRRRKED